MLDRYDTAETTVITRKELQDIKDGKWDNAPNDHTIIRQIERK